MQSISWHGHYLRPNHQNRRPTNYVFVDVETRQTKIGGRKPYTKHELELGVACAVTWKKGREPKEEWFDFVCKEIFWGWLGQWQKKKEVLWVVFHNASFDLSILGLWKHIENGYYRTRIKSRKPTGDATGDTATPSDWQGLIAIDGSPFHIETEGPRGRVNFTDLQNFYQCQLADVGRTVGVEKGSLSATSADDGSLLAYCRTDVEILKRGYLGLVRQWESEQNGNWQFSAASLANSHYRHKYLNDPIAVHSHRSALEVEWSSLYGGEVRAFYRGSTTSAVVHYDVNSLYPSCMVDGVFPTALVDVVVNPSIDMAMSLAERYACVAEVYLETADDLYPLRRADRIVYPTGRYCTTLAGPELWAGFDGGNIRKVYTMAIYTYADIFKRFVLDWWERKRVAAAKGDVAGEKFAKLMLNSLPAKFAQRTPVWETDERIEVVRPWSVFPWKDPDTGVCHSARSVGWVGQVQRHRRPTENAFPAIYSYVTSYARERMRLLRSLFPAKSVYYQDTDSLFVDKASTIGNESLLEYVGDGLGQLRVVAEYDRVIFRGPKNYTADGRHVISGIRSRDRQVADMQWHGERFERINHLFCRQPDGTLRAHEVELDTPGSDAEGGYDPDGWYRPLKLP